MEDSHDWSELSLGDDEEDYKRAELHQRTRQRTIVRMDNTCKTHSSLGSKQTSLINIEEVSPTKKSADKLSDIIEDLSAIALLPSNLISDQQPQF